MAETVTEFPPGAAPDSVAAGLVVVDLTTSRRHRGQAPAGIVRTEREIGKAFLRRGGARFMFFDPALGFRALPREEAEAVLYGRPGAEPAETYEPAALRPGETVLSPGLHWDSDALAALYRDKRRQGFRVCQVVYDMIPVLMPEFSLEGMAERFSRFILDALWTADAIFGISECTNAALAAYAREVGAPLPPLHRLRLGCDIADAAPAVAPPIDVLRPGGFVLCVGTIEPRKNHILLYHLWRRLLAEHPDRLLPLVLVGTRGWNSDDFLRMLAMDGRLNPDWLAVMHGIDDAALGWLYRHCAFTLYPSLYEGWGLPVAESLGYGKRCIAANAGGIPEAAQGCAELLDPLDFAAWYRAVLRLLEQREAAPAPFFRPLGWAAAMDEFCAKLTAAPAR